MVTAEVIGWAFDRLDLVGHILEDPWGNGVGAIVDEAVSTVQQALRRTKLPWGLPRLYRGRIVHFERVLGLPGSSQGGRGLRGIVRCGDLVSF